MRIYSRYLILIPLSSLSFSSFTNDFEMFLLQIWGLAMEFEETLEVFYFFGIIHCKVAAILVGSFG